MSRKQELCNKNIPLRDRLRLFEATVSKRALYGSETWTMSREMQRRLQMTQRKMLRWMVGSGRRRLEGQDHDEKDGEHSSTQSTNSEPQQDMKKKKKEKKAKVATELQLA